MQVTVKENTAERKVLEVETINTEMNKEFYSVITFSFNGKEMLSVSVLRTNKNGKEHWAQLNEQKHRFQIKRVLEIVKKSGL